MTCSSMIEVEKKHVEALLALFDVLNEDILNNLQVARRHYEPLVDLVGELREAKFDIECQEEHTA